MAGEGRPPARWPLVAGALLIALLAAGALFSKPGVAYQRMLLDRPLMRAAGASTRIAPPPDGFVLRVDPAGRYTVSAPADFKADIQERDFVQLKGPATGGLPTYLTFEIHEIDGPIAAGTLAELEKRSEEEEKQTPKLLYSPIARQAGTLDGRPAISRTYLLGSYEGWQISAIDGPFYVELSLHCRDSAFPAKSPIFSEVVKTFRFASEP